MRKLLPYVRKNSSEIYVELGSSHIEGIINNAGPIHAALTEYLGRFQKRVP